MTDGGDGRAAMEAVETRNGLPLPGYRYRAARRPWAERAIARAEAEHGAPD